MQFTFLGTSSGTPTRKRNISALAIGLMQGKRWMLVDCGEATQHQLQHTSYSLVKLQAIFITHVHGDHCYGLPGLLASAAMAGRKEALVIVGPKALETFIRGVMASTELYLPYTLRFVDVATQTSLYEEGGLSVDGVALSHRVPSYAFRFRYTEREVVLDKAKLEAQNIPPGPVWGKLQRAEDVTLAGGRTLRSADFVSRAEHCNTLVVAGDNDAPQLLKAACSGADVLIHEATYTAAQIDVVGPGLQHSCARRVATFAQSVAIPHLILTHFSPRYQESGKPSPTVDDIYEEAAAHYDGALYLAKDFDTYRLNRRGHVVLQASAAAGAGSGSS